jgi:5-methylcytosine-specific restriction enzyme subunit McrC
MRQLELYEFGESKPLPAEIQPLALKRYLQQVWQNRHGLYQYAEEETPPFAAGQPFLHFDEGYIQARNYAGLIHFQGITIYLIPKLFEPRLWANTARPDQPVGFFLSHLSFYLSYCRQVRFPLRWQPTDTAPSDWLHHWIRYFASFTAATLTGQPYLTYQTHTDETTYLRGKLAVQPYLNEQLSRGQWQRLQTEQQPFVLDNLFNQIVKYTAGWLENLADAATQGILQEILWLLNDVEPQSRTAADCDAVHLNRLYPNHQEILEMCRFFLAGMGSGDTQTNTRNFAFLVPMERIFEDFVAGFVLRHFPEWQAECQKSVALGIRTGNRVVQVRPDLWLPFQHMVWDTKYKPTDTEDMQPLSADLYQMLAYASACQTQNAHLLYASTAPSASETIRIGPEDRLVQVHTHALPIVLSHATDTFSALTLRLKETLQKIAAQ